MDLRVAAYAVVTDDDDRVLLARWVEGRRIAWTMPGGGLEPGEDPEVAVRRELRAKLDELTGSDREIGEALHALVTENAPSLVPRTYYGMPAWAKDGKVLCFFQPASKFKVRYATFGFETGAALDEGNV